MLARLIEVVLILLILGIFYNITDNYVNTKQDYPSSLTGHVYDRYKFYCVEGILYKIFNSRSIILVVDKFGAPRECKVIKMSDKTFNKVYGDNG